MTNRIDRRFIPRLDGTLERRDNPGPLWGGLWDFPQSTVYLTGNNNTIYPVSNGTTLRAAINVFAQNNIKIKQLFIKGHGGDETVQISEDPLDTFACIQGHIRFGGEEMTAAMQRVTDPSSEIFLTGCGTGPLATSTSIALPQARVTGNVLPKAIGIPWTSISLGWYVPFVNGKQVNVINPPLEVKPPAINGVL